MPLLKFELESFKTHYKYFCLASGFWRTDILFKREKRKVWVQQFYVSVCCAGKMSYSLRIITGNSHFNRVCFLVFGFSYFIIQKRERENILVQQYHDPLCCAGICLIH